MGQGAFTCCENRSTRFHVRSRVILLACLLTAAACRSSSPPTSTNVSGEIVIYCSVDEAFARPLLREFEAASGMTVRPLFDTEAGKTTGLVERLRQERDRPRADVWWSSEIFGTIELAQNGILTEYRPKAAEDIPKPYRDPTGRWTAFALRGRIVVYDPRRIAAADVPGSWHDMADPQYADRIVMANPQFGTTRGHMAALLAAWGEPAFRAYLEGLARNGVRLADGNAQCVMVVTRGQADFGWTDTDDAYVAQQRGDSIAIAFAGMSGPQGAVVQGTLWIPNSCGLVAGGPNPDGGRRLIEYICSAGVERKLAESESGNIPVRESVRREVMAARRSASASQPADRDFDQLLKHVADVDYGKATDVMRRSDELTREILMR